MGTQGLMYHLVGTACRPPTPPPWPCPTPASPLSPPSPSAKPAAAGSVSAAASSGAVDPLAGLTDEEYLKKVEDAEDKANEFEQFKYLPDAASVWTAVTHKYKGKSEMYANSVQTKLLNLKCMDNKKIVEHLDTMVKL
ncbi:hypothetical protein L226DRAFT_567554 [Lentinus tigrinus ALCF2SS1-7]|nr:hypothetical protein L226DRAFT_567554 [Lentinus tigrinus ALCF2SS1-7]